MTDTTFSEKNINAKKKLSLLGNEYVDTIVQQNKELQTVKEELQTVKEELKKTKQKLQAFESEFDELVEEKIAEVNNEMSRMEHIHDEEIRCYRRDEFYEREINEKLTKENEILRKENEEVKRQLHQFVELAQNI